MAERPRGRPIFGVQAGVRVGVVWHKNAMPRSEPQAKPGALAVWARLVTRLIVALCAVVLALTVLATHAAKYPHFAGFWVGVDQQRYLDAAQAWAGFDLSPGRQHYLPLYPLMAAPFVWLTPWQPFMLPDLACLLASLLLFVWIGRRLAPGWPDGVAALCFVVAVMGSKLLLGLWIVPWSSTGAAPFQFAALLLALRFGERPGAGRAAALGLCIAMIAGFRPSDAAVVLVACGGFAVWSLWARRRGAVFSGAAGLAAFCGLAAGLLAIGALHWLVFGFSPGPYIAESAGIGFEWRLLPMRWVMLVVGPRPLLPEGSGMVAHLPWLIPGIAGLLLALVQARGRPVAPAFLTGAAVALHWALYLVYRDMHADGLWRFYNIHYFKWTFPFLVFWAAQCLHALSMPGRRRRALVALAVALLLFAWRPVLRKPLVMEASVRGQHIGLPRAPRLDEAVRLPVVAGWTDIYFARTTLMVGGREYVTKRDTKLLPVPGGALLVALRKMPGGPATLDLPENIAIQTGQPAVLFRQAIVFGW